MPNHTPLNTPGPIAMPSWDARSSLTVSLAPTATLSTDAQFLWCQPAPYTGRRVTTAGYTAYELVCYAFGLSGARCLETAGLPTVGSAVEITRPEPNDDGLRALFQAIVLAAWRIRIRHEARLLRVGVLRVHDRQTVRFVRATHGRVACEVERGDSRGRE